MKHSGGEDGRNSVSTTEVTSEGVLLIRENEFFIIFQNRYQ